MTRVAIVQELMMEFEIDEPFVQGIIADEYARTREEIAKVGPLAALERSQQRHDSRLSSAPDADTLACKAGCSWCCYFSVDVRPVEVLRMIDFVRASLSPEEQQRIANEITHNSRILGPLDDIQRMQQNIKCPFLLAGRCSIYTARPQTCRNYHATDAAGCEQSFNEPGNTDIDPEFAPLVYQAGGAHVDAFSKAMGEAGYDISVFELNTALAAAMAQPEMTRQRFEAREPLFADLAGTHVVPEFIEE